MKICHMTSVHSSEDTRIFYKECVSLSKAGYETYLVAPGETRDMSGVHIIGVGDRPSSRIKRMIGFARKVYEEALATNALIYHIHDPELLPYVNKLKKKGYTVIFDSHEDISSDISEKTWIPGFLRLPISGIYNKYFSIVSKRLDAVISVTPHLHKKLQKLCKKTVMITNYPILRSIEGMQKHENKNTNLCFTGGINPLWNHHNVISAIAGVEDVSYVLCGESNKQYLDSIMTLDGWINVIYLGKITFEDAMHLQESSNVGMAICSYCKNTYWNYGTLGNTKLFEYMMAGLPVICTNFILWQEIVDKYHCGICVTPSNIEDITDAIVYLRDHPEEARSMGEDGRRAVEQEFNWASQEAKLLELYASLIHSREMVPHSV